MTLSVCVFLLVQKRTWRAELYSTVLTKFLAMLSHCLN